MERNYSTILFDWDGCLFDSLPLWLIACRDLLSQSLISLTDMEIARVILPELDIVTQYGIADAHAYVLSVLKIVKESLHLYDFNVGALPLIEYLAGNETNYAIVSSSERVVIQSVLRHQGLENLFPLIVSRNDVGENETKPNPKPLLKALKAFAALKENSRVAAERSVDSQAEEPQKVLMVGDSEVDVAAGKAANKIVQEKSEKSLGNIARVDTALYFPPAHELFYDWDTMKATNPTYVVRSFAELQQLIGGRSRESFGPILPDFSA